MSQTDTKDIAAFQAYIDKHLSYYQGLTEKGAVFALSSQGKAYTSRFGPIIGIDEEENRLYYYDTDHGIARRALNEKSSFNSKPYKIMERFGLTQIIENLEKSSQAAEASLSL